MRIRNQNIINMMFVLAFFAVVVLTGCSGKKETGTAEPMAGKKPEAAAKTAEKVESPKLKVIATTNIAADVVSNIGGDRIKLSILIPSGTSPHTFQPRPVDLARISAADIVFISGAGLEEFMGSVMKNIASGVNVVSLSEGIKLRQSPLEKGEPDPHVWFSPANVIVWVKGINKILDKYDPKNSDYYDKRALTYTAQLKALDKWVFSKVETLPENKRLLVTDHFFLGYFAERYSFIVLDAIYKSHTTAAEPSAKDVARLVTEIKKYGIKAIFVGKFTNKNIAAEISRDTGARVVPVYTGTLDSPGGQVDTYIKFIRYDVAQIAENLK